MVQAMTRAIFTYLKSREFYAGVQIDGTIVIERTDEKERFYGERIPVADILAGKVRHPPYGTKGLMATIKAAQGDTDSDQSLLPTEAAPLNLRPFRPGANITSSSTPSNRSLQAHPALLCPKMNRIMAFTLP